jgi:hypothetical protein
MSSASNDQVPMPDDADEIIVELNDKMKHLETLLAPYWQLSNEDLHRRLTPAELAKLDIYRAFVIHSLFFSKCAASNYIDGINRVYRMKQ